MVIKHANRAKGQVSCRKNTISDRRNRFRALTAKTCRAELLLLNKNKSPANVNIRKAFTMSFQADKLIIRGVLLRCFLFAFQAADLDEAFALDVLFLHDHFVIEFFHHLHFFGSRFRTFHFRFERTR